MSFGINSYAKIKQIKETTDAMTVAKISTSHKNRQTNKYECDFIGYVKFVGDAHQCHPMEGQKIKIINCSVSNCYVSNDTLMFNKSPQYIVYKYELQTDAQSQPPMQGLYTPPNGATDFENLSLGDDLPF